MTVATLRPAGLTILGAIAGLTALTAQPLEAPAFTVVTIKQNLSDSRDRGIDRRPGGRVIVTNNFLRNMILNLYRLQDFQLVGGPDWMATDRWDIIASAERDLTEPQLIESLKRLLAERFQLRMHTETRAAPVYALVRVRPPGLGPQLTVSTTECEKTKTCGESRAQGQLRVTGLPIGDVVRSFERISGRPVIDRTGLTARYDFILRWRPDGVGDVNTELPSLFTAIEDQLGLKLQADTSPVEVLVIDAVERPATD